MPVTPYVLPANGDGLRAGDRRGGAAGAFAPGARRSAGWGE